jgi:predicted nucleotide-binding protein
MARKPVPPSEPPPAPKKQLSPAEMRRGIENLKKRLADLDGFNIGTVRAAGNPPEIKALAASIERTLAKIFGEGTSDYRRYVSAVDLPAKFSIGSSNYPLAQHYAEQIAKRIQDSKHLLQEAINQLNEELEDAEAGLMHSTSEASEFVSEKKVFVVHGHDEAALHAVARFLERLKLEVIVLREQPDQGRTIIEKFEDCANEVGFAVVLLTPDNVAGAGATSSQTSRTRQNVIFELGYFVGKLGRGRACLLRKGEVEIPSDLYGVIYTEMDAADGWKLKLVRELEAAELDFDANRMWT